MNKKCRNKYPLELIITGINFLKNSQMKSNYKTNPYRSLVVYTLEKINNKWLPLNREYKPIGLSGYGSWAKYEDYRFLMFDLNEVYLSSMKNNLDERDNFYFFKDGGFPKGKENIDNYIKKVEEVFCIQLEPYFENSKNRGDFCL
jgi:hypothetical protein